MQTTSSLPAQTPPGPAPAPQHPARKWLHFDSRFAKRLVWVNGAVPGLILAWDAAHHQLGANGVNYAIHTTGLLGLIFLILSLAVTPLRRLLGVSELIAPRRSLGLYAFFYLTLHFLIFFAFDRAGSVSSTVHEILTRRYLQVGTVGFVLMVPLAVTSTNWMVMRLGAKRWKALHRLVYVTVIAGATHYILLVKSDIRQPVVFATVVGALLLYRVVRHYLDLRAAALTGGGGMRLAVPAAVRKRRFWSGEMRVAKTFDETHDVRTFRLTLQGGGPLPFDHRAGQYLSVALTIDGKRVNRSYTIASSPTCAQYCEITVKRAKDGYGSRHLHESLREGKTIKVSAPAGRFVFTGEGEERVILIAAGVGITPLMAIVRYLTDTAWAGQIWFLIAARSEKDLIFREELSYLQKRFPNLHVEVTLSGAAENDGGEHARRWTGKRGRISKDILTTFLPDLRRAPIYLCGPESMMVDTRKLLVELGAKDENVLTEAFVSPGIAGDAVTSARTDVRDEGEVRGEVDKVESVDDGGMPANIQFARSEKSAALQEGQTILEAAEEAGVAIPFECRSGICGQCKTKLVEGRVTMDVEDALTSADKRRGLVLACQARAARDVIVDA